VELLIDELITKRTSATAGVFFVSKSKEKSWFLYFECELKAYLWHGSNYPAALI